jgi:hypothetical protein
MRRNSRENRPLTPAPSPAAQAEDYTRQALIDTARIQMDLSELAPIVRHIMAPLPELVAMRWAETLVVLGAGYEYSLRTMAGDRDEAWSALAALAAEAARLTVAAWTALATRTALVPCPVCGRALSPTEPRCPQDCSPRLVSR